MCHCHTNWLLYKFRILVHPGKQFETPSDFRNRVGNGYYAFYGFTVPADMFPPPNREACHIAPHARSRSALAAGPSARLIRMEQ